MKRYLQEKTRIGFLVTVFDFVAFDKIVYARARAWDENRAEVSKVLDFII